MVRDFPRGDPERLLDVRAKDGARPLHYDLTLTVVPGDAKAPGEIAIDVELSRPHSVL